MLIVTVKPRADALTRVEYAVERGVRAFRVNFARRAIGENVALLEAIGDVAIRRGAELEFWIDLPGPKARLGEFANESEFLSLGRRFIIYPGAERLGDADGAGLDDVALFDRLESGDTVIVADGAVHLTVNARSESTVECEVAKAGRVHARCGVVAPRRYVANRALTRDDRVVAVVAARLATHVCASFVDSPQVVHDVRAAVGPGLGIVAKIESPIGVAAGEALAAVADGLVLARGDLRAFYSDREMRRIASQLKRHSTHHGAQLVLASNYFRGLSQTGVLTADERDEILWALALSPEYLMINETSHSPHWRAVVDAAVDLWPRDRRVASVSA